MKTKSKITKTRIFYGIFSLAYCSFISYYMTNCCIAYSYKKLNDFSFMLLNYVLWFLVTLLSVISIFLLINLLNKFKGNNETK